MSDTEDQHILEDIRALEDALSRKSASDSIPEVPFKTEIIPCTDHLAEETDAASEPFSNSESVPTNNEENLIEENIIGKNIAENLIENSAASLKLNQDLIKQLVATRGEVAAILEECKRKRGIVNTKIKQRLRVVTTTKTVSSHAGMPYFKDKDFFSAPPNEDTKLKDARGELQIIHLRRVSRWTAKDKEMLLKSIHHEVVAGLKNLNEDEEDEVEKMTMGRSHSLPSVVIKAIGPLGTREFDWMKIAVTDFQNKHSAEECRVMWNIFLHPDINKFKWKKKELTDLEKLVKKYKYENWDAIAKDLGTKRSGYQCFVKYNTVKKVQQNDKPWTKQEDKKVIQLVNKFKIGDFINWGDVASCVKNRTKQQIYFRWMYSLAPHLKKGRFTEEEDKLLIDAIEKYGLNFKKISTLVLPTRTSAQLSDHYNTIANKEENVWTIEQDEKLLKLYHEYGTDWAKIATFFDTKGRVQVRHRYAALVRYEKKGLSLNEIPRNISKDKGPKEVVVFHKIPINTGTKAAVGKELDEVDKEIIKYFQNANAPPSRPGRKQKFYTGKELEFTTRKMYNTLQLMSANLNIGYDLDEFDCLSEKDKQLLSSLKNISHDATYGAFSRKVEQMRLMMFDFGLHSREGEEAEEDEHFIPPLPFGGYMKTNKTHRIINYVPVDSHLLEDREKTFETPLNVIEAISEDVHMEFDKIGELLVRPNYKSERQAIQTIYILTPEDLIKKEMSNRNQEVQVQVQSLPSTSTASNSDVKILRSYNKRNTFHEIDTENFPTMKPSFATLLGYQGILNASKVMNAGNVKSCADLEGKKMPEKVKVALDLLRIRLVQLFKYPIIMSQVMPPENIHEKESIFLLPEKRTNYSEGPSRKKRKTEGK